eukprot:TRINITY_DN20054_c0_g1_i1.p1 TRINITY_DN20054_c0_g1~~TRINITY_DN20054_c0_g1_i1.p1  ORF type:complete len:841 (+),score=247.62 TRINITY_DN20054_c0_g1_i1:63-2525(+)
MASEKAETLKLTLFVGQAVHLREVKTLGTSQPHCRLYLNGKEFKRTQSVKGLDPRFDQEYSVPIRNPDADRLRFVVHSDSGKVMGEAHVMLAELTPGAPAVERWLSLQIADHDRTADAKRGSLQVRLRLPYLMGQEVLVNDGEDWVLATVDRARPLQVILRGSSEPQSWDVDMVKPMTAQDKMAIVHWEKKRARQFEELADREEALERREAEVGAREKELSKKAQEAASTVERFDYKLEEVTSREASLLAAEQKLEDERRKLHVSLEEERAKLAGMEAELQEERTAFRARCERAEQLEAAAQSSREECAKVQADRASAEASAEEAQRAVMSVKAELATAEQRAAGLEEKVGKFRQALQKQQSQLSEALAAGAQQQDKVARYRQAVQKLRKDNEGLREQLEKLGEEVSRAESPQLSPGGDASHFERTISRLAAENAALRAEVLSSPPVTPAARPPVDGTLTDSDFPTTPGSPGTSQLQAVKVSLRRLVATGEAATPVQLRDLLYLVDSAVASPGPKVARRRGSKNGPAQVMRVAADAPEAASIAARREARRQQLLDSEAERQGSHQRALAELDTANAAAAAAAAAAPQSPEMGGSDCPPADRSPCPSSAGLSSSVVTSDDDAVSRLEAFHQRVLQQEVPREDLSALWAQYRERPRELHQQLSSEARGDSGELAWLLQYPAVQPSDISLPGPRTEQALEVTVECAGPLREVKMLGTSSPFCVLEMEGRRFHTKEQEKNLNPTYNETFKFPVSNPARAALQVTIKSGAKLMGECGLRSLDSLPCGVAVHRKLALQGPKDGSHGNLHLILKATGFGVPPESACD